VSRRAVSTFATAALAAALLVGCGGDEPATDAASVGTTDAATSPAAQASPTLADAMDARAVIDALKKAGLPLSAIAEQNEDTDPNDKIGRPGGYTSRASADLPSASSARP
jgi:hypothetical protein